MTFNEVLAADFTLNGIIGKDTEIQFPGLVINYRFSDASGYLGSGRGYGNVIGSTYDSKGIFNFTISNVEDEDDLKYLELIFRGGTEEYKGTVIQGPVYSKESASWTVVYEVDFLGATDGFLTGMLCMNSECKKNVFKFLGIPIPYDSEMGNLFAFIDVEIGPGVYGVSVMQKDVVKESIASSEAVDVVYSSNKASSDDQNSVNVANQEVTFTEEELNSILKAIAGNSGLTIEELPGKIFLAKIEQTIIAADSEGNELAVTVNMPIKKNGNIIGYSSYVPYEKMLVSTVNGLPVNGKIIVI